MCALANGGPAIRFRHTVTAMGFWLVLVGCAPSPRSPKNPWDVAIHLDMTPSHPAEVFEQIEVKTRAASDADLRVLWLGPMPGQPPHGEFPSISFEPGGPAARRGPARSVSANGAHRALRHGRFRHVHLDSDRGDAELAQIIYGRIEGCVE